MTAVYGADNASTGNTRLRGAPSPHSPAGSQRRVTAKTRMSSGAMT